jgi:hypothetical protein
MRRSLHILFGWFLLFSTSACERGEDESIDVEQAMDSFELSQQESALVVASIAKLEPGTQDPNLAAVNAAAAAGLVFRPAECVDTEIRDNTVRYVLSGCTGPFKTARIEGTLDVVYTVGADGLHALGTATGLRVGAAVLDIESEGSYSLDGDGVTRRLVVGTRGSGTGPRGHRIDREGSYAVTWNEVEKCVTFDGTFETRVSRRDFRTQVSRVSRCAGECPKAGGEIVHEAALLGIRIRITFDGTSEATWTSSKGAAGKIDLLCGA